MSLQEIGFTHMRILEGVGTLIQLAGLAARLCKVVCLSFLPFKAQPLMYFAEAYEARTLSNLMGYLADFTVLCYVALISFVFYDTHRHVWSPKNKNSPIPLSGG